MTPTSNRLTRRRLLQIGGIGAMGLGMPELLRAGTTASATPRAGKSSTMPAILE